MSQPEGSATLRGIWIKRAHRGVLDSATSATLIAGKGIDGNVDRSRRRQVTIIDEAAWKRALAELGAAALNPSARRANFMVCGLDLEQTRGRVLVIGAVRFSVGGETRPCERMDEAHDGLQDALDPEWRGGVFAQVLSEGVVSVGDPVSWEV
ncbi:MAG: MOSC domain-containing protein [Gemmatimonadales bacterium]